MPLNSRGARAFVSAREILGQAANDPSTPGMVSSRAYSGGQNALFDESMDWGAVDWSQQEQIARSRIVPTEPIDIHLARGSSSRWKSSTVPSGNGTAWRPGSASRDAATTN